MTHIRLFQATPLALKQIIFLDSIAHHHLSRVMRSQSGDTVILFNGQGGEYEAIITDIDKKQTTVLIESYSSREVESPVSISLAQAIVRGEKMDWIIQKAVELGVTHIVPLVTQYGQIKLDKLREEKRILHWQRIIISACEQSGRNRLPILSPPTPLSSWLAAVNSPVKILLSPHSEVSLKSREWEGNTNFTVLIGPEGGFSTSEIHLAETAGFTAIRLGPRILRTETAPLAILSILQSYYGDF